MLEAGLSSEVRTANEVFDEARERGTLSELLIHAKCFVAILISYNKLQSTKTRWLLGTDRDFFLAKSLFPEHTVFSDGA
jgi:hypothetical protein